MSTRTIGLIACSKTRVELPPGQRIAAGRLYTGTLFRRASMCAQATCDTWFILSANHGLVTPDTPLAPYDLSLYDLSASERRMWAEDVVMALDILRLNTPRTHWLILAGKVYREHIVPHLRGEVEIPLEGLGIGEQIAKLNRLLSNEQRQRR